MTNQYPIPPITRHAAVEIPSAMSGWFISIILKDEIFLPSPIVFSSFKLVTRLTPLAVRPDSLVSLIYAKLSDVSRK